MPIVIEHGTLDAGQARFGGNQLNLQFVEAPCRITSGDYTAHKYNSAKEHRTGGEGKSATHQCDHPKNNPYDTPHCDYEIWFTFFFGFGVLSLRDRQLGAARKRLLQCKPSCLSFLAHGRYLLGCFDIYFFNHSPPF